MIIVLRQFRPIRIIAYQHQIADDTIASMYADIDQRAVEGTGGANDVTNRDWRHNNGNIAEIYKTLRHC